MPVWYNPLGTRATFNGTILLAAGANFVFGFNGIVHLEWVSPGAPSAAYFEHDRGGGNWSVLRTFLIAGGIETSMMVATGITRIRRQAIGVGIWGMRYSGWRFQ